MKATKTRTEKAQWVQIQPGADSEEFQKIVRLLVEFDEKTGRYLKYNDPETHFMRRAASVAASVRFFAKDLGGFIYSVVAIVKNASGHLQTGWVHEDGIKQERIQGDKTHPVNSIVCLTDLFERAVAIEDQSVLAQLEDQKSEAPGVKTGGFAG